MDGLIFWKHVTTRLKIDAKGSPGIHCRLVLQCASPQPLEAVMMIWQHEHVARRCLVLVRRGNHGRDVNESSVAAAATGIATPRGSSGARGISRALIPPADGVRRRCSGPSTPVTTTRRTPMFASTA